MLAEAFDGDAPGRPLIVIGDEMYPVVLANAVKNGHILRREADARLHLHDRLVKVLGFDS